MSAIFLSHSSADNRIAAAIGEKLAADGHRSVFLDFDPTAGIPAGRDWEQELYRQLRVCEAVIVLCSENSMASQWCFAEITHAKALGKQIFPAKIAPCSINTVLTSRQVLDFTSGRPTEVYERLRLGLKEAGLDPASAFNWDGSRPPYPGLLAFDEADAAIFFGRDAEIQQGLELLNRRSQFGGPRMVIVLGASGSGKSSLVRAGMIPRLRNSDRWIVVDTFRPREDPIHELAAVLCSALGRYGTKRSVQTLRDGLGAGEYAGGIVLNRIARELQEASGRRDATVLITVDQMEELIGPAAPPGGRDLLVVLQKALSERDTGLMAMGTLRSDFLGELQNHPAMREARFDTLPVGPMPTESLAHVIDGPAGKAGIDLEDGLTQSLIADTVAENALPMLAFTLRELYERFGGDGRLTIEEYSVKLGGMSGSVAKAADAVFAAEPLTEPQMADLRNAFLGMVRVNEAGQFARQLARWNDLPESIRPLLQRFVQARLLVVRGEGNERVVEVAHEAIFRAWDRLKTWLAEDREFLLWRKRLKDAVAEWARLKGDRSALLHGPALAEARSWFDRQRTRMTEEERQFVSDSIAAANRERRRRRIAVLSTMAVLAVAAAGGIAMWLSTDRALKERTIAEAGRKAAEAKTAQAVIGYAWVDLGAKQEEIGRLTAVAKNIGANPGDLVPNVRNQPDGFDCGALDTGSRYLYCSVRSVISFQKVKSISGLSIFLPGGPHEKELNLNDPNRFGHYNPEFLAWLERVAVPQGLDDPRSQSLIRLAYNTQIGPLVRTMYHAHQILFAGPEAYRVFAERYRAVRNDYLEKSKRHETREGLTGFDASENPVAFKKAKAQYLKYLGRRAGPNDSSGADSSWLADYLYTDKHDDWYLASIAEGFWIRRSIDGTEAQVFRMMTKVLQAFDPNVLATP